MLGVEIEDYMPIFYCNYQCTNSFLYTSRTLTVIFSVLTCMVAFWVMFRHFMNIKQPWFQVRIIGISRS